MAQSFISLDGYFITQQEKDGAMQYALFHGETLLAIGYDVGELADIMWANWKASRLTTMQRVNNPNIRITMTIR